MEIKPGLKLLPKDDRDYHLGAIAPLTPIEDLPESFMLGEPTILDQNASGDYDYCTAYASCGGAKFQDGVDLYPPYIFAAGRPEEFGQDLRTAMKLWREYGCAEDSLVPKSIKELPEEKRRDYESYPNFLRINALDYVKPSFFSVLGTEQGDTFDTIKRAIYRYRDKKQVVYFGINWHWDLSQYSLGTIADGSGHCMYIVGWDKDGLVAVNSCGREAGRNGLHNMPREVTNYYAPLYGAYMMTDIPLSEAKRLLNKEVNIFQKLGAIIRSFFNKK